MFDNNIIPFVKLIRSPNLIIVGLTQFFIQYLILIPAFKQATLPITLNDFHFFLLVICTICIAAAGYIINDIIDEPIDKINKPDKVIIGQYFAVETGYRLYWGVLLFGGLIAFYLANYVGNLSLVGIYFIANILLYLYSKNFKQSPLIGNLIVSIFCAFVAGIVLFSERASFTKLYELGWVKVTWLCYGYLIFAFVSTMFREIIKDMEDIEGDKEKNCKTLPILIGIRASKFIAFLFGSVLLLLTLFWMMFQLDNGTEFQLFYLVVGIVLPILFALIYLIKANEKKEWNQLSRLAKYIMVSGIFYLLLY